MSIVPQAKLDQALQALAARPALPGEMIDVLVSIARPALPDEPDVPPGDRLARVAQAQARFAAVAAPVLTRLGLLAAENVRPLWLAHAVAVRVPHAALAALADDDMVTRIALDTERKMI
jgi:hypothetical protein